MLLSVLCLTSMYAMGVLNKKNAENEHRSFVLRFRTNAEIQLSNYCCAFILRPLALCVSVFCYLLKWRECERAKEQRSIRACICLCESKNYTRSNNNKREKVMKKDVVCGMSTRFRSSQKPEKNRRASRISNTHSLRKWKLRWGCEIFSHRESKSK